MSSTDIIRISGPDQLPAVFLQPYAYWDECRAGSLGPRWPAFHLEKIRSKLLPWSIVVDVVGDDFVYRFWGSERTRLIGLELTGKLASQIPHAAMRDANIEEYRQVAGAKVPMLFNTLIARSNDTVVHFQSLRLPISDDGVSVTKIFSALDYEQVNELHFEVLGAMLRESTSSLRPLER